MEVGRELFSIITKNCKFSQTCASVFLIELSKVVYLQGDPKVILLPNYQ